MKQPTYNQSTKTKARKEGITEAVKLLTKDRYSSTLASKDYLRNVWNHYKNSYYDTHINSHLSLNTIERWEHFYKSVVTSLKPSNLKVAYLCGPNPINDLDVMVENGILVENVWAFESDKGGYSQAVNTTLRSKYPFLKIYKGDIGQFIENTPIKFDLIYLDFCGPIFNRNKKQKNLKTLVKIAKHHALKSPGVLITNFSLITKKQDKKGFDLLSKLIASYLFPKEIIESETGGGWNDGPLCQGHSFSSWNKLVRIRMKRYYSQFITRLVMDIFTMIVPMHRFMNNDKNFNTFFSKALNNEKPRFILKKKLESIFTFSKNGGGGDVYTSTGFMPLLWTLGTLNNYIKEDSIKYSNYQKLYSSFINQLVSYSQNPDKFTEEAIGYHFLMSEGLKQECFYSDTLKAISKNWKPFDKHIFCDVFLFHQLKDILVRQLSFPYHCNVEKTKRWSYKAKDTTMYMDLFVFDECRYLYDWLPTIDMLEKNMKNQDIELSFRYVLDSLSKHAMWYYSEYLYGTAAVSREVKGFEDKVLKKRKRINN